MKFVIEAARSFMCTAILVIGAAVLLASLLLSHREQAAIERGWVVLDGRPFKIEEVKP